MVNSQLLLPSERFNARLKQFEVDRRNGMAKTCRSAPRYTMQGPLPALTKLVRVRSGLRDFKGGPDLCKGEAKT